LSAKPDPEYRLQVHGVVKQDSQQITYMWQKRDNETALNKIDI